MTPAERIQALAQVANRHMAADRDRTAKDVALAEEIAAVKRARDTNPAAATDRRERTGKVNRAQLMNIIARQMGADEANNAPRTLMRGGGGDNSKPDAPNILELLAGVFRHADQPAQRRRPVPPLSHAGRVNPPRTLRMIPTRGNGRDSAGLRG